MPLQGGGGASGALNNTTHPLQEVSPCAVAKSLGNLQSDNHAEKHRQ